SADESSHGMPAVDIAIAQMSEEWVEKLHQAAIKVNAKQICQLIEEISPHQAALAKTLTSLVNDFLFEEIIALTQSAMQPDQR
ncbi:hypothetical protein LC613_43215, partial [Nostoc sphaeroides CHAB 2801]